MRYQGTTHKTQFFAQRIHYFDTFFAVGVSVRNRFVEKLLASERISRYLIVAETDGNIFYSVAQFLRRCFASVSRHCVFQIGGNYFVVSVNPDDFFDYVAVAFQIPTVRRRKTFQRLTFKFGFYAEIFKYFFTLASRYVYS